MGIIAPITGALILAVLFFSLAYLLAGKNYGIFKKRLASKTLCSLMFWAFGWFSVWYSGLGLLPFVLFMLLGFTMSVAGDVLLVFKSSQSFMLGLGSFFLAHVAYSVSFILRYGFNSGNMIVFAIIAIIAFIVLNFSGLFTLGKMRVFANLYLFMISFMLANAVSALIFAGPGLFSVSLTALGAALFFYSDLTLAYEKFSGKEELSLEKPILISYYLAQILLALGMMTFT